MKKVVNVIFALVALLGFLLIIGGAGRLDTDNAIRVMDVLPQMIIGLVLMGAGFVWEVSK